MPVCQKIFSFISFLAVVWLISHVWFFVTPWTAACQVSLPFTIFLNLLQTNVHWVSDTMQPSHPLLPLSPPALNVSQSQGLFQWVNSTSGGQSIGTSASAPVLPINTQSWFPLGFRFDLWAFQGSLESLLQHILKALIFRHSTFFMVQLWHPYMTTEKNVALTIWTFVFINEGDAKTFLGFPWWLRQLRICMKFRRHIFSPWLGKIPWKIKWLQTPVFMPRRFHFQRNLAG